MNNKERKFKLALIGVLVVGICLMFCVWKVSNHALVPVLGGLLVSIIFGYSGANVADKKLNKNGGGENK